MVRECQDLLGTNVPRARTMLDAYPAMARWAHRHGLLPKADVAKLEQTIGKLLKVISR